jgi:hypothetical protein
MITLAPQRTLLDPDHFFHGLICYWDHRAEAVQDPKLRKGIHLGLRGPQTGVQRGTTPVAH